MKKFLFTLILLLSIMAVPTISSANNNDLAKESSYPYFAVVNGGTYYLNTSILNSTSGLYKMSSNLKSHKLIVKGNFSNLQIYKNTFIVYDDNKEHAIQLSLDGKVLKNFTHITTSSFKVYGNHIYYYNLKDRSFYQSQIVGNKVQFLHRLKDSYVDEFMIHNGWVYYVHAFSYGEYGEKSEDHLSKFQISKPATAKKLISNMYNIDSLIAKNGYIYAVVHKNDNNLSRNLYRMNLNGSNLTRISKENMNSGHAINSKYVYFVENSFNDRVKLYQMTINGKNVKAIATLPGRQNTVDAIGKSLYFTIQDGSKYIFQRRTVQ